EFIGLCLNWGLLGCIAVQTINYHFHFPRDRCAVKALVFSLSFWDVAQTAIFTQFCFSIFAQNFGDASAIENIGLSWLSVPIMGGISSFTVQSFYAWRLHHLSGCKWLLSGSIVTIALAQGSSAIAVGIRACVVAGPLSELQENTLPMVMIWLIGSAVCDLVICISMMFFVSLKQTSYKETEKLLKRAIVLVTALTVRTASVSIVEVTLYTVYRHNSYHIGPAAIIGKLYTNVFLILINSR
ncbi:hypothetical protein K488DRAFT_26777, partial [Vararia minispora EC-137]